LRNVTRRLDDSQGVEFGGDHADNIAAVVMQRSAAITGLNRRADLQKASCRYAAPPRN
jgi:hypothetical protein